ncbi:MAG: large subunit ribosomal protein L6 [Parasphingorhabdus sp.]|jgi:large subunit ribosomal protein L6
MSRVAKSPVTLPKGVDCTLNEGLVKLKGPKGELSLQLHPIVGISENDGVLSFKPQNEEKQSRALAGTMRSLVNNMVAGVSIGFEKKLTIIGVGYRAQAQGGKVNLSLGFSHPVVYEVPEGVTVETPTQTEMLVKGVDKQKVGQVAAELRAYRPPEPYKGKGVRYADEYVLKKQAKKK